MKYLILLSIIFTTLFTGCQSTSRESTQQLSIAINSWVGFDPIRIAKELGYYDDLGIDLEIKEIEDIAAVKAAVESDQIDLTWGTGDVLLTFADAGIDVQAFYAVDWSNGGDGVLVSDKIQSWSDFEGKEFVGQEGLPPANLLLYALKENGIDVSTIKFREMDTAAAALAFKAGQVDIAAVFQPYLSKGAEREDGRIFLSSADYPYVITDYISAKESTLQSKKDLIEKFVKATDRGVSFIHAHPTEAAKISAEHGGLTPEEVLEIFQDIEFPTLEENKTLFSSFGIVETFTTFQSAMLEAGVLRTKVKVEPMINSTFVQ